MIQYRNKIRCHFSTYIGNDLSCTVPINDTDGFTVAGYYTQQTKITSSINSTLLLFTQIHPNDPLLHALPNELSLVNEPLYPGMSYEPSRVLFLYTSIRGITFQESSCEACLNLLRL